jgi:hypothetical protein
MAPRNEGRPGEGRPRNEPPTAPAYGDWNEFILASRHMNLDELRAFDRLLCAFPNTRIGTFEWRADP